ncbi:hypothetical protein C4J81_05645 [Deltaproteobacteria bacterium Smac51]|nr:hypothetical protein C4J81_05645 [Deltaproteobacteria bacterium Smac51]
MKGDRGGETFRGIARNIWGSWPGWSLIDGVKKAGMVTAKAIDQYFLNDPNMAALVADFYRQNFWRPFEGLALPGRVMAKLFDTAINMGHKPVVKFLQESLNALNPAGPRLSVDGIIGAGTRAAAASVFADPSREGPFLNLFCGRQEAYYRGIVARRPGQAKFLKGWLRRAAWQPAR